MNHNHSKNETHSHTGCACCHTDYSFKKPQQKRKEKGNIVLSILQFALGISLLITAYLIKLQSFKPYLYLLSYIVLGYKVIYKAIKNIFKGKVLDENFLMLIATVGAFILREYLEAVAVMLFYLVGEFFQDTAVSKSKKSIVALMDIRPDFANIKVDGEIVKVNPESVKVGDIVYIKPFERVPLDAVVIEGESYLDTKALTGESNPRAIRQGDTVLSGSINQGGFLTVQVAKEFSQSTASKIIDLVENASSKKTKTEKFMTLFSKYYTPIVVVSAILLALIPSLITQNWNEWIHKGLIFLVISCPCALVISVPFTFFSAIGNASRNGILIKGSNYLDALNNLEIAVFDKTGTLTEGAFKVSSINPEGVTKEELLEYSAYCEAYSSHPIAQSIINAFAKEINKENLSDYKEISGLGVSVKYKNTSVLCGSAKLMNSENIDFVESKEAGTKVYVALEGKFIGSILISDKIKTDSFGAISHLKEQKIKTVMLTGDNKEIAQSVYNDLKLDEFYSELLPNQKVELIENLSAKKSKKGKLAFVGDGINDAPVLKRADIGIAMGGLGSDAAIEAADIVFMTDEPSKLIKAKKIAKKTRRIALQNIIFALSIKVAFLTLSAFGLLSMWIAVFADTGVALLAVLNSLRASK